MESFVLIEGNELLVAKDGIYSAPEVPLALVRRSLGLTRRKQKKKDNLTK